MNTDINIGDRLIKRGKYYIKPHYRYMYIANMTENGELVLVGDSEDEDLYNCDVFCLNKGDYYRYLWDHFYTKEEERKLKLEELNGKKKKYNNSI